MLLWPVDGKNKLKTHPIALIPDRKLDFMSSFYGFLLGKQSSLQYSMAFKLRLSFHQLRVKRLDLQLLKLVMNSQTLGLHNNSA